MQTVWPCTAQALLPLGPMGRGSVPSTQLCASTRVPVRLTSTGSTIALTQWACSTVRSTARLFRRGVETAAVLRHDCAPAHHGTELRSTRLTWTMPSASALLRRMATARMRLGCHLPWTMLCCSSRQARWRPWWNDTMAPRPSWCSWAQSPVAHSLGWMASSRAHCAQPRYSLSAIFTTPRGTQRAWLSRRQGMGQSLSSATSS